MNCSTDSDDGNLSMDDRSLNDENTNDCRLAAENLRVEQPFCWVIRYASGANGPHNHSIVCRAKRTAKCDNLQRNTERFAIRTTNTIVDCQRRHIANGRNLPKNRLFVGVPEIHSVIIGER
ncbi:hypothetical protein AB6A40_006425 [Gnathostoma spinigerum]|uniref:Uncharacterized protein n=1 Tax=Gnathostoma spinigerum TaxID=75299 RepID=A0ABD6EIZ7_9BILA